MKKMLGLILLSTLAGQWAFATCAETPMSEAARKMRLAGKVSIVVTDKSSGEVTDRETDTAKKISTGSEEMKELKSMVAARNLEILSQAIGIENDATAFVVTRNKTTCDLSLYVVDGDEDGELQIVADGIKRKSISFQRGEGEVVTISRSKASLLSVK